VEITRRLRGFTGVAVATGMAVMVTGTVVVAGDGDGLLPPSPAV